MAACTLQRAITSNTKSTLINTSLTASLMDCGYDGEMTSAKEEKSESSSSDEDEESLRELVRCQHLYSNFQFLAVFTVIDCGLISVRLLFSTFLVFFFLFGVSFNK